MIAGVEIFCGSIHHKDTDDPMDIKSSISELVEYKKKDSCKKQRNWNKVRGE